MHPWPAVDWRQLKTTALITFDIVMIILYKTIYKYMDIVQFQGRDHENLFVQQAL